MKLTAYKELDSSKRAQTLSRIILIAGAHLVVIGGAYLVTKFSGNQGGDSASVAGVGTWSSQSADANASSVDPSASSLFDSRAANLNGYNAGESRPMTLAANTASNATPSSGRFEPRRPGDSSSSSVQDSAPAFSNDDDFLQPIGRPSSELYPVRSSSPADSGLSQTIDYKVQSGDSLWGISKRFKVTTGEIIAVNPGIKANAIRVGQSLKIPRSADTNSYVSSASDSGSSSSIAPENGTMYTVKAGDNLSRIASRQGITVPDLRAANGLPNDTIIVGQKIVIPAKTSSSTLVSKQHRGQKVTVKSGDTIGEIAATYGVTGSELMSLNNITDARFLRIGQTLLIPEKAKPVQEPTPTPSRSQPTQPRSITPEPNLPILQDSLPPQSLPTLPTLDDSFGEEDLEDQPLIQILE